MTADSTTDAFPPLDYGAMPRDPAPTLAWIEASAEAPTDAAPQGAGRAPLVSALDGRPLAHAPLAEGAALAQALEAGERRPAIDAPARAEILRSLARRLAAQTERAAMLACLSSGAPIRPLDAQVGAAIAHLDAAADLADDPAARDPGGGAGKPLPPAALAVPGPAPLARLAALAGVHLAAGAGIVAVVEPAGTLCARHFAALAAEAGLPREWLSVLTSADPEALTGTRPPAGQADLPLIVVMDDADLDGAADAVTETLVAVAASATPGPVRLYMQESVAETFAPLCVARLAALRPGDPCDPATDLAVGDTPDHAARRAALLAAAPVPRLYSPSCGWSDAGCVPPILAEGVEPAHPLITEGSTGPLVLATTFRTADEAARLAHQEAPWRREAALWGDGIGRTLALAHRLSARRVGINAAIAADGGPDARSLADIAPLPRRPAADRPMVAAVADAVAAARSAAQWRGTSAGARSAALRRLATALAEPGDAALWKDWAAMTPRIGDGTVEATPLSLRLDRRAAHGVLALLCEAPAARPAAPETGADGIAPNAARTAVNALAASLAAGNAVVAAVPSAMRDALAQAVAEALPDGAVTFLDPGLEDLGRLCAAHPDIDAVVRVSAGPRDQAALHPTLDPASDRGTILNAVSTARTITIPIGTA